MSNITQADVEKKAKEWSHRFNFFPDDLSVSSVLNIAREHLEELAMVREDSKRLQLLRDRPNAVVYRQPSHGLQGGWAFDCAIYNSLNDAIDAAMEKGGK